MRVRSLFAALLLTLGLAGPALAAVNMLPGAQFAVTNATNSTPVIVTFSGTPGHSINDQFFISGVGGNTAANGIRRCSAVAASTCTLQSFDVPTGTWLDTAASGAYTSGGIGQLLGVVAVTTGKWIPCAQCLKISGMVWSTAAPSSSTVNFEGTSQPFPLTDSAGGASLIPSPITPGMPIIANPIVNATTAAAAQYFSLANSADFIRAVVNPWVSGTIYAVLTCETGSGVGTREVQPR